MVDFVVKREKWRRGGDPSSTYLLSKQTGEMCCLGFCALTIGATEQEIMNKKYPAAIGRAIAPLSEIRTYRIFDTDLSAEAAKINDNEDIDDAARERRLKRLFKQHGHTIRFE